MSKPQYENHSKHIESLGSRPDDAWVKEAVQIAKQDGDKFKHSMHRDEKSVDMDRLLGKVDITGDVSEKKLKRLTAKIDEENKVGAGVSAGVIVEV